jgi:hypothetical protein
MGVMSVVLAFALQSAAPNQAVPQLFDLTLHTEMRFGNEPGGKSSGGSKPLVKGQSLRMRTYSIENSCGFASGTIPEFDSNAAIGWQLDAMPVAITGEHAVIRLHWSREVELGKRAGKEFKEVVVLLRPGDSLPLDTFVLPETAKSQCGSPVATLIVGLKAQEPDRKRVASTDLWLVHKQPGGKETMQHINVRGELNSSIPFFFDEERVGTAVLDVFGQLTLRPKAGDSLALEFSAQRLLAGEQYGLNSSHFGSSAGSKVVLSDSLSVSSNGGGKMVLEIGPDSVTSFEIPQGSGPEWKAFAGHSLSVRVKSKRMR